MRCCPSRGSLSDTEGRDPGQDPPDPPPPNVMSQPCRLRCQQLRQTSMPRGRYSGVECLAPRRASHPPEQQDNLSANDAGDEKFLSQASFRGPPPVTCRYQRGYKALHPAGSTQARERPAPFFRVINVMRKEPNHEDLPPSGPLSIAGIAASSLAVVSPALAHNGYYREHVHYAPALRPPVVVVRPCLRRRSGRVPGWFIRPHRCTTPLPAPCTTLRARYYAPAPAYYAATSRGHDRGAIGRRRDGGIASQGRPGRSWPARWIGTSWGALPAQQSAEFREVHFPAGLSFCAAAPHDVP